MLLIGSPKSDRLKGRCQAISSAVFRGEGNAEFGNIINCQFDETFSTKANFCAFWQNILKNYICF